MKMILRCVVCVSSICAHSFAAVWIEARDMGVPQNGAVVMAGYRGYLVSARSDQGRIKRINVGNQGGVGGQISGGLAQRWENPSGTGTAAANYSVRSPGPLPANNTFDTDFNFDSHFTMDPGSVVFEPINFPPGGIIVPAAEPLEVVRTGSGAIQYGNVSYPGLMPLPSTPTVGYFVGRYPYPGADFSQLLGSFTINEANRADNFEFAYVVTNSIVDVVGVVTLETGLGYVAGTNIIVPEPELVLVAVFAGMLRSRSCP